MSNDNTKPVVSAVPAENTAGVAEKQNIAKRGWNFVKSHKKAAFAVAGLGALVVVSAALGRSTASPDADTFLDQDTDDHSLESETTVAN